MSFVDRRSCLIHSRVIPFQHVVFFSIETTPALHAILRSQFIAFLSLSRLKPAPVLKWSVIIRQIQTQYFDKNVDQYFNRIAPYLLLQRLPVIAYRSEIRNISPCFLILSFSFLLVFRWEKSQLSFGAGACVKFKSHSGSCLRFIVWPQWNS